MEPYFKQAWHTCDLILRGSHGSFTIIVAIIISGHISRMIIPEDTISKTCSLLSVSMVIQGSFVFMSTWWVKGPTVCCWDLNSKQIYTWGGKKGAAYITIRTQSTEVHASSAPGPWHGTRWSIRPEVTPLVRQSNGLSQKCQVHQDSVGFQDPSWRECCDLCETHSS